MSSSRRIQGTYHSDEKSGLLGGTPDTRITDNTDSETGGETSKTDGKTSTELNETSVQWHGRGDCYQLSCSTDVFVLTITRDQNGDDETVLQTSVLIFEVFGK